MGAVEGIELWGDWAGALNRLRILPRAMRARLQGAMQEVLGEVADEVRRGLAEQAPAGHPFAPLHPFTLAMRVASEFDPDVDPPAGPALLHTRRLFLSIGWRVRGDGLAGEVGVFGDDAIQKIAVILQEGAVVPVSDRMRGWLAVHGLHLRATTTHLIIPPRPFLMPVLEAYKPKIRAKFRQAIFGLRDDLR